MNHEKQLNMAEATRLTRAGRLKQATALIQRTLANGPGPAPGQSGPGRAPVPGYPRAIGRGGQVPGGFADHVRDRPGRSGAEKSAESRDAGGDATAGRFVEGSSAGTAGGLRYKAYLPSSGTGASLPLVVMLHGGTQGADDFAAGTRMNRLAEKEGFLVVYPEQSARANTMKYWNWFQADNQRRGSGEPAAIAGITRDVIRDHGADPSQVYVAGFSAGGAMAAVMAATYPDLYAAAGVHSGLAYAVAHDVPSAFKVMKRGPSRDVALPGVAIPLIVFHGDGDKTVDRVNADRLVTQWRSATARAGSDGRTEAGPTVRRSQVPGGRSYTHLLYPNAQGGAALEQWTVHGVGHAWSGGGSEGSYTDTSGPDASAEMARFFRTHRQ